MLLSSNTRSCRYNQLLTSSMYPLSQQHIVSFLPYRAVNDLFIRHGRDQFQRSWLDRSETFSQNSDQAIAFWTRQQWASAVFPCTNYLLSLSQYLFALDLCFKIMLLLPPLYPCLSSVALCHPNHCHWDGFCLHRNKMPTPLQPIFLLFDLLKKSAVQRGWLLSLS